MILNVSIALTLIATQVLPFLTIYGGTLALIACVILRYRLALSGTLHDSIGSQQNHGEDEDVFVPTQNSEEKKKQHETGLRSSKKCETTVEIFASLKRQ